MALDPPSPTPHSKQEEETLKTEKEKAREHGRTPWQIGMKSELGRLENVRFKGPGAGKRAPSLPLR